MIETTVTTENVDQLFSDSDKWIRQEEKELFAMKRVRLAKWKVYMDAIDRREGKEA